MTFRTRLFLYGLALVLVVGAFRHLTTFTKGYDGTRCDVPPAEAFTETKDRFFDNSDCYRPARIRLAGAGVAVAVAIALVVIGRRTSDGSDSN